MKTSRVVVAINDSRLARALEGALVVFLPDFTVDRGSLCEAAGEVVVTTPASCSPAQCRELSENGSRVIVISPLAPRSERENYEVAGAFRYLPMVIDATSELASAVRAATVSTYSSSVAATASLTALIQDGSPRDC